MIKIYCIGNMKYTPFGDFNKFDLNYLNLNNIYVTDSIQDADVLVAQQRKHLKKYFWQYRRSKKYLLWTNEPRLDVCEKLLSKEAFGLASLQIMNVYNSEVFINAEPSFKTYFSSSIEYLPKTYKVTNTSVIALMSYYKGLNTESIVINSHDVDLIKKRTQIVLYGNDIGSLDIYGKGWPDNRSKEDSREGNWGLRKRKLMDTYNYNLCFENTVASNYISEKIWDSISNYCLPIYHSGNNIYELFPEESFIDYNHFSNPKELFDFINGITHEQFITRFNKCVEVYNTYKQKSDSFYNSQRELVLNRIIKRLKE